VADFGASQAVVLADLGARALVPPGAASAFEMLLCGRVGAVRVMVGGEVRLTVPPGRIGVAVEGEDVVAVVDAGEAVVDVRTLR